MTEQGAHQAVVVSALLVSGTYFYRKLTAPAVNTKTDSVPPLGRWIVGFGAAFFALAVIASVSPALGAGLAILLAAGTILVNGADLAADINHRTGK